MVTFAMPSNTRGAVFLCLLAGVTGAAAPLSAVNYAPDRFQMPGQTAQIFLLPDTMYDVLAGTGGPTLFVTFGDFKLADGMFLPASYGALDAQFLAAGLELATDISPSFPMISARRRTQTASLIGTLQFANDIVAPARFDSAVPDDGAGDCSSNTDLVDTIIPGGIGLTIAAFDCEFELDFTCIAISGADSRSGALREIFL